MKLNKTTKSVITVAAVAALVELWRDWPWLQALVSAIKSKTQEAPVSAPASAPVPKD